MIHESINHNLMDNSEEDEKLKGDAIGDTAYTQRSVLKTLLKLKEIDWNSELEEELCFLWDSTVEKEVCEYLIELSYPNIASNILANYDVKEYERLIEIIVGILGNIFSLVNDPKLSDNELKIIMDSVLDLLSCTDSLVLVQVMRFIIAISVKEVDKLVGHLITEDFVKIFEYILENYQFEELAQKTLESIAKLSGNSNCFVKHLSCNVITTIVNKAEQFIVGVDEVEGQKTDFELISSEQGTVTRHVIETVCNLCVFLNENPNNEHCIQIRDSSNFISFISKVISWFSRQENLLPLSNEIIYYFDATNYIFRILDVKFDNCMFKNTFLVLFILLENDVNEISEFVELFCYFLSIGQVSDIKNNLKPFKRKVNPVLRYIEIQNLDFGFNYLDVVEFLINEFR